MYSMKKGGSSKSSKQQAAIAISMKAAGKKPKMKMGGSLKPVDSGKNPGLAKLPTAVRNKMGYQKMGGSLKKYKMAGPVEGKPVIKGIGKAARKAAISLNDKPIKPYIPTKSITTPTGRTNEFRMESELRRLKEQNYPKRFQDENRVNPERMKPSKKMGGSVKSKKK